jgi:catechol 2,3-dioxygenase-like lactoylglutathione lyase family enzyme
MSSSILGIHHVTAIAAGPQPNLDFYTGFLGMRLVKKTVNFDDPGTYHLYYGDQTGSPGSIMTFFPWPGARPGRHGSGQVSVTSFAIPKGSLGHWIDRARKFGISTGSPAMRFDHEVLDLYDPDGLQLELVASLDTEEGNAIGKIHSATISQQDREQTARLLTETMGFRLTKETGNRSRYEVAAGGPGAIVDLLSTPGLSRGSDGVGTVHHIAWRTADDLQQRDWHKRLIDLNYNVSPIMDRQYFHSIYYREPGGVLFEIATDPPGFAIDEPVDSLGTILKLPPMYESRRELIERALPPLEIPAQSSV